MNLREGFRLAGLKAEIEFLAEKKFTGTAVYWMDGKELRRRLTHVFTGDEVRTNGDGAGRMEKFLERLVLWAGKPDGEIAVIFKHGAINRIEF